MGHVTQQWTGSSDVPNSDLNDDGSCDPRDFRYWVADNPGATEVTDYGLSMYLVSTSTYDADGDLTESDSRFDLARPTTTPPIISTTRATA